MRQIPCEYSDPRHQTLAHDPVVGQLFVAGFRRFSVDLVGDLTISCSHCNSLSGDHVKQAKTLTDQELEAVLHHVKQRSHSSRNRAMILMTFWAGFRVGEVAALQYCNTAMSTMTQAL